MPREDDAKDEQKSNRSAVPCACVYHDFDRVHGYQQVDEPLAFRLGTNRIGHPFGDRDAFG